MPTIFLTHEDEARAQYYGEEALARLRALGEVRLNETGRPLTTAEVIKLAAGCPVIVSYRQTALRRFGRRACRRHDGRPRPRHHGHDASLSRRTYACGRHGPPAARQHA